MPIKIRSTLLLLAASITLAGCQAMTTVPSQVISQDENVMTMQADTPDSDGDGVLDDIDECPATPENVVIDERGCPSWGPMSLHMEYRAFFEKGSSELPLEYQLELDRVAEQMNKYDTATMQIEANISEDEVGKHSYSLSKDRALMVKNYLILKHDIATNRLNTSDCGAKAPIASSDTEEGKSLNRRVYASITEPEEDTYEYSNDSKSGTCIDF